MQYPRSFDVLVVGGGHAGTEAALAAARAGADTLLLSHNLETLGQMSCNPAVGGIGKGHIVREIDALGGAMARAIDRAGIQFRTLNARKGPAVRATRAQADRALYRRAVRALLERQPGLTLLQGAVEDLLVESTGRGERVTGVLVQGGMQVRARAVVLTTGTFLGGRIHIGESNHAGGRAGDPPANALAARLRERAPRVGRLKTGTPPRLDGATIDYARLEEQPGDTPVPVFSFLGAAAEHPRQVSCHIAWTCGRTHELIRDALHRSPMYSGAIESVGPRYCPSIEDKVVRFADKPAHQVFIEPEGLDTREVYPNGISTSLPFDVQWQLVRSMPGLENAVITRPGYAIEYDYLDPRDLRPSLESRTIAGLFLAGQINGTTGYEEAAGQGIVAGINAAMRVSGRDPWWPRRDEAYIGVLIDDLVTRGLSEPYRMFTSRAEHRLLLREDNADLRLTATGRRLGVVDEARWRAFCGMQERLERERARLGQVRVRAAGLDPALARRVLGGPMRRDATLAELLARPGVGYRDLMMLPGAGPGEQDPRVAGQLEVEAAYSGYIERQEREIALQRRHEDMPLPEDMSYDDVRGLSHEVRQVLARERPATLGQASRVPGVTPAAVSLLLVHLRRREPRSAA